MYSQYKEKIKNSTSPPPYNIILMHLPSCDKHLEPKKTRRLPGRPMHQTTSQSNFCSSFKVVSVLSLLVGNIIIISVGESCHVQVRQINARDHALPLPYGSALVSCKCFCSMATSTQEGFSTQLSSCIMHAWINVQPNFNCFFFFLKNISVSQTRQFSMSILLPRTLSMSHSCK